jgi:hypothetical protein
MGGGTIRLSAIGPQDFHLTANPQITHFKSVFKRHTNFSKETKRIFFNGEDEPSFGSKDLQAVIRNEGDLLGRVYLEVTITGTNSANTYTVANFSNSLLDKVRCDIGGFTIDTNYGRFYQIQDELEGNIEYPNQNLTHNTGGGLYTDIVRNDNDLSQSYDIVNPTHRLKGNHTLVFGGNHNGIDDNTPGTYTKKFYVPLRFWFNKTEGQYLPLVSLYQHRLSLYFDFTSKEKLIGDNVNLTNLSMSVKLFGDFYYLDHNEKTRFAQTNHEYIIEQHQLNNNNFLSTTSSTTDSYSLSKMDIELNFSHPIKYFTWVIVNEGTSGSNKGMGPCYFSSLTQNSLYGNDGNSGSVEILLEGTTLEQELPMIYYTRLIPYNYFRRVPALDRVGFYSFALNPFYAEPSGTCNFSKIYNKNIKLVFANNNVNYIKGKQLYIYAVNYNVLTICNGMAQVRYA